MKKTFKKCNIFFKENVYIFIILGVSFLLMSFTLLDRISWGNDYPFAIANILSLENNLKPSLLEFTISKITNVAGYGLGYGTYIFYPIFSHIVIAYISSFIKLFGINLPETIEIAKMLILFFSGLTMYFFVKKVSKNKDIALISSISYICAPYFLSDLYIRCALAESCMFIFMPLILNGLYELLYGEKRKFYILFIIGYLGIIYSHLVMSVYFTFTVLIFLLFNIKKILNDKLIKHLIISGTTILLIASPFYVPILEHKILGDYVVFSENAMINDFPITEETLSIGDFFSINNDNSHFIHYEFNIIMIFILVYVFYNIKKFNLNNGNKNIIKFLLIISVLFIILISDIFPWDKMPSILQMIQFPWRLLMFSILGFSVISGYIVKLLPKTIKKISMFIISILIIIVGLLSIPTDNFAPPNFPENLDEWGMGSQHEYLPLNAKKNENYLKNRGIDIKIISGKGKIQTIKNDIPYLKIRINVDSDNITIELPRIYYLGYSLKFIDKNNNLEFLQYSENENGLIETKIKEDGILEVEYSGTKLDKICNIISLITIFIYISLYIFIKLKKIKIKNCKKEKCIHI